MTTATDDFEWPPRRPTLADVLTDGIPIERVILVPTPGTATVVDVERVIDHEDRLCELVDGILVERAYGFRESLLNADLIAALVGYARSERAGFVVGAKAPFRLGPRLVRAPDVSSYARASLPDGRLPAEAIAAVVPDLVVDTWKLGNTRAEIDRKLREYRVGGVRLIWFIEPAHRLIRAYSATADPTVLDVRGFLDGGSVLPGFRLKVGDLLDEGQYGDWGRLDRSRAAD